MKRLLLVLIAVLSMTAAMATLTSAASTQPPVTSFIKVLDPNFSQEPWAGGFLVYLIEFEIDADATNVTVEENLLDGLTPGKISAPGFHTTVASVAPNRYVLDFNNPGTLGPGTYRILVEAQIDPNKYAGRKYIGQAVNNCANLYIGGGWKAGGCTRTPLQAPPTPSE